LIFSSFSLPSTVQSSTFFPTLTSPYHLSFLFTSFE
jgi:hypothetical protein